MRSSEFVANGSRTTDLPCPRNVRFSPRKRPNRCVALSGETGHNRSSVQFNVNFGFVRWLDRQNELEQRPALAVR